MTDSLGRELFHMRNSQQQQRGTQTVSTRGSRKERGIRPLLLERAQRVPATAWNYVGCPCSSFRDWAQMPLPKSHRRGGGGGTGSRERAVVSSTSWRPPGVRAPPEEVQQHPSSFQGLVQVAPFFLKLLICLKRDISLEEILS